MRAGFWRQRSLLLCTIGVLALTAALVVGLWPMHANGMSGNALVPHYSRYIGVGSFKPLPVHATLDDLRHAGVRLPQDAVRHRRFVALYVGILGAAALSAGLILRYRAPRT